MASTFAELYQDFKDAVKVYTEKLDVNEMSFMRRFSQAMQHFQRETELVEIYANIVQDITSLKLIAPFDLLRILEVRDCNNWRLLLQNPHQLSDNVEGIQLGKYDTPRSYSHRTYNQSYEMGATSNYSGVYKDARMVTLYDRIFTIFPKLDTDISLQLWYIPDMHAISSSSAQWADWFPEEDNFLDQFYNTTLRAELAPYEFALLAWVKSDYIQSQGSKNYLVFENYYKTEVERAKLNKPNYVRELKRPYQLGVKS